LEDQWGQHAVRMVWLGRVKREPEVRLKQIEQHTQCKQYAWLRQTSRC
jgi:hypothetical protein